MKRNRTSAECLTRSRGAAIASAQRGKIIEAIAQGVEAFSKEDPEAGKKVKKRVAQKMGAKGGAVQELGDDLVQAAIGGRAAA